MYMVTIINTSDQGLLIFVILNYTLPQRSWLHLFSLLSWETRLWAVMVVWCVYLKITHNTLNK